MTTCRTTTVVVVVVVVALAAAGLAGGFAAGGATSAGKLPRLVFPVFGPAQYEDDFGDARGSGAHEGIDVRAPKRALALAAEAGHVKYWARSSRAGCMLYLYGRSGTTYLYIHLNNDLTDANDNQGRCTLGTAYAVRDGARVQAGQAVAFVGDSGDADGIGDHLHFEVHPGDGPAANPFPLLQRAIHPLFPVDPAATVSLSARGTVAAAESGVLTLNVASLVVFPTGARVAKLVRPLVLRLPNTAQVDLGDGTVVEPTPDVVDSLSGKDVVVLTEPARATLGIAVGGARTLTAARVAVQPAA
jgi:hypothetical protein